MKPILPLPITTRLSSLLSLCMNPPTWRHAGWGLEYWLDSYYDPKIDRSYRVVSFQYTTTNLDWFFNLLAFPTPFFRRHLGHYLMYLSARHQILRDIRAWPTSEPIIITGYSQGCAFATYLAWTLRRRGNVYLVNFAPSHPYKPSWWSPLLLLQRAFYGAAVRVVAHGDPVPFVPPLWEHAGIKQVYIGRPAEFPAASNHLPEHYQALLSAAEKLV